MVQVFLSYPIWLIGPPKGVKTPIRFNDIHRTAPCTGSDYSPLLPLPLSPLTILSFPFRNWRICAGRPFRRWLLDPQWDISCMLFKVATPGPATAGALRYPGSNPEEGLMSSPGVLHRSLMSIIDTREIPQRSPFMARAGDHRARTCCSSFILGLWVVSSSDTSSSSIPDSLSAAANSPLSSLIEQTSASSSE